MLLPELQRIKETIRHQTGGPMTPSRTPDTNLHCVFIESTLVSLFLFILFIVLKIGRGAIPLIRLSGLYLAIFFPNKNPPNFKKSFEL